MCQTWEVSTLKVGMENSLHTQIRSSNNDLISWLKTKQKKKNLRYLINQTNKQQNKQKDNNKKKNETKAKSYNQFTTTDVYMINW